MNTAVSIVYTGFVLGSIFATSAVGLALMYGTLRFLNLAHGGFLIVGGYVAWLVADRLGVPFYFAMVIATVAGAGLGLLTYFSMLRPLLGVGSPRWDIATIMASVGLAIIIEAVILLVFGPRLKSLPPAIDGKIIVGTIVVQYNALFIGVLAVLILVVTHWFLKSSRSGIALRAVAENVQAAYLMGIPSGRVFASTVAIAGALATAAGVLLGSFYLLRPSGGLDPMMTAIVVVVFGGLGSIPGTIVAAYIIGMLQAAVSVFLGVKWASPVLFAFMILVLIVRPYGLYGRPEDVRV